MLYNQQERNFCITDVMQNFLVLYEKRQCVGNYLDIWMCVANYIDMCIAAVYVLGRHGKMQTCFGWDRHEWICMNADKTDSYERHV